MQGGADVRGYLHASLVDGFGWTEGYRRGGGLLRVDRATQERHVTGRALLLGEIAREGLARAG